MSVLDSNDAKMSEEVNNRIRGKNDHKHLQVNERGGIWVRK